MEAKHVYLSLSFSNQFTHPSPTFPEISIYFLSAIKVKSLLILTYPNPILQA